MTVVSATYGPAAVESVQVSSSAEPTRYHALDSLRAVMMLSGIYLHAVVAYSNVGGWPYKQAEVTSTLNWSLGFIHTFRMPLFYVMAGFFGALLRDRRGLRGFIDNRVKRVLLPFIVGWMILFPMVLGIVGTRRFGPAATFKFFADGGFLLFLHPMHLWFLEYLVILYALGAIATVLVPAKIADAIRRVYAFILPKWWAPLFFAIPSFFALLPMRYAGLEDPPGFVPITRIVIAYVVPFTFGWLLYSQRGSLDRFARAAWPMLGAGLFASAFYLGFLRIKLAPGVSFYADRAVHSIALWFLIFGFTGLFLRYLSGHSPKMRYMSDSSYFLYLAHMPVLILLQLAVEPLKWSPLLKIPLVLLPATAILIVLYHYVVRPTFIGAALNGRRYPIRQEAGMTAAATA